MKNKGFTLIELLAVIVILAIIALIATPTILGIIENTKEESNKRSIELYADAIKNEIASFELKNNSKPTNEQFKELVNNMKYKGAEISCEEKELYEDYTFYIGKCSVNGGEKIYSYGIEGETPGSGEAACTRQIDEEGFDTVTIGGTETFYVMYSEYNEETIQEEITMLSKYNLYVGNVSKNFSLSPLENPTNKQDSRAKGWVSNDSTWYGVTEFSSANYWESTVNSYPSFIYVYNKDYEYGYLNEYEKILKEMGVSSANATMISYEQLEDLGCSYDLSTNTSSCSSAPSWVYSTSYWIGEASGGFNSSSPNKDAIWAIHSGGSFALATYGYNYSNGIRPVVTISASEIQ